MALREFEDASGRRWLVWDTVPAQVGALGEFAGGWLTFDDGAERRRLAPVPEGWEAFPEPRLALLLRVAEAPTPRKMVERRRGERREGERRVGERRATPRPATGGGPPGAG
jgi:hypothetical protein